MRQVVHHVPDSHLNAYIRFKLALTEQEPTIKPYAEDRWAQLADTGTTPVEVSLTMLDALHDRWIRLLRSLQPADWKRTFRHPELGSDELWTGTLALYTPGTDAIMWRISPRCANARAGKTGKQRIDCL